MDVFFAIHDGPRLMQTKRRASTTRLAILAYGMTGVLEAAEAVRGRAGVEEALSCAGRLDRLLYAPSKAVELLPDGTVTFVKGMTDFCCTDAGINFLHNWNVGVCVYKICRAGHSRVSFNRYAVDSPEDFRAV